MPYRFVTCDVFTPSRFGGNQLAVFPDAAGLDSSQMQEIAREFNFSETAFVFPAESGHTRRVRIFTPSIEVPFAGHPNIGTAFVLAATGLLGPFDPSMTVTFEEEAGIVSIAIGRRSSGRIWCELQAPQPLSLGKAFSVEAAASAVSLAPGEIVTDTHAPLVASVGLPFLFVELRDRGALRRARPNLAGFEDLQGQGLEPTFVHLYVRDSGSIDLHARVFAPLDGPPEDPATGSANCALAALLSHFDPAPQGEFRWRIAQGDDMGRPSRLEARARKQAGSVVGAWIGGESVLVSEGQMDV